MEITEDEFHFMDNDIKQFLISKLSFQALRMPDLDIFTQIVFETIKSGLKTEFVVLLNYPLNFQRLNGLGWNLKIINSLNIVDFQPLIDFILEAKKPVIISNFQNETNFTVPKIIMEQKITSGICVPLFRKDRKLFGILGAFSREKLLFNALDQNFLLNVSFILSSAIIQSETLEQLKAEMENNYNSKKENEELLRIAQKMEALGRLSGSIAHGFNNHLSVISGYVEKLLNYEGNNLENQTCREDLTQIKKTAEKATLMIKDLLNFSHIRNYNSELLNLNDLIKDMANSLKSFVGESIRINFDYENNLFVTRINPNQLQQSILNLIINAKDSLDTCTKENKTLNIKTFNYLLKSHYGNYSFNAEPGEYVAISIKDNGLGLSDLVKSHLFEPFFTTKESEKSTGLGLSSVYGLVKSSNGFMTVEGKEHDGAIFTIYLPKSIEAVEEIETRISIGNDFKNRKITQILLVDDNEDLRDLLILVLGKKYKVLSAPNGIEALKIIKNLNTTIDLIITDVVMPEMDGFELVKSLIDLKIEPKIIMMTGYSLKDPINESKYNNFYKKINYISKPFSINSLLSLIEDIEKRTFSN